MAINSVIGGIQTRPILPTAGDASKAGAGFGRSLSGLIDAVESSNASANDAVSKMVDGSGDVHDAMIALQRADLTFQFSVQVRNKLVQAYQEIMRMPV
jgi:flagellar hook-basal body complex protein FliE